MGNPSATSVIIVSESPLIVYGLRNLFEQSGTISVGATHSDITTISSNKVTAKRHRNVLLVDSDLLTANNQQQALDQIVKNLPVILLNFDQARFSIQEYVERGAQGFLARTCLTDAYIESISAINHQTPYLCPDSAKAFALANLRPSARALHTLTHREREVFLLLAKGQSVNRIAEAIHLSPKTVHTHRSNAFKKLGISSAGEAGLLAVKEGLLDISTI